jgi:O-antigen/teichoic acid export membrane protein
MAFARNLMIYGVGGAASRLAAILLVPLYTHALPQSVYGRLELLLALHALAVLVVGVQGESALARDWFEATDKGWADRLAGGALAMVALGTAVVVALAGLAWLTGWMPAGLVGYLPLVILAAIPAQVLAVQLLVLRFSGKPAAFAGFALLDLVSAALFSAGFILWGGYGIAGALLGILAGKLVCLAAAWPLTFARVRLARPGREVWSRMLGYAAPTLPSVFLNWLQSTGTRVILALFLSFVAVAIAGIAIKVAALYAFLVYSVRLAWEPIAFDMLAADSPPTTAFRAAWNQYAVLMLLAAGLATAAAPIAVAVLTPPGYESALPLAGFFIIGQFWTGALTILAIGIHGARLTSRLTPVYLSGAILNVLAIAILAPVMGAAAAGVGSLIGSLASAAVAARLSEAHYPVRFGRRLPIATALASTVIAVVGFAAYAGVGRGGITAGTIARPVAAVTATTLLVVAAAAMLGLTRHERIEMRVGLAPLARWGRSA